jgi:hypothetical protein
VGGATATVALAVAGCGAGQIPGHGTPGGERGHPGRRRAQAVGRRREHPGPGRQRHHGLRRVRHRRQGHDPLAGVTKASKDGDYLCLTLGDDTGCSLEVIDIGATRRSGGSVSDPAPGQPNGWWWGSDAPSCGTAETPARSPAARSWTRGSARSVRRPPVYAQWQVSCQNADLDFDPRVWWLPTSKIAFREHSTADGAAAAVDRILAGVTFGS